MCKPSPRPPKIAADIGGGLDNGGPLRTGTLLRGLAIVDILIPASHPLSLAEATHASLDLSTTFRLLRALEDARHVIRIGDGKRYVASPKALRPVPLLHRASAGSWIRSGATDDAAGADELYQIRAPEVRRVDQEHRHET